MSKKNVASGNDRVALQVGRIIPPGDDSEEQPTTGQPRPGRAQNICDGNAQVGAQADTINGPLTIIMRRR